MAKRRRRRSRVDGKVVLVIALAVLLAAGILFGALKLLFSLTDTKDEEIEQTAVVIETEEEISEVQEQEPEEDAEDPQNEENMTQPETGAETEITKILTAANAQETADTTLGIDVAKYQGTIDWTEVAASGIDFVMVRVGYRTQNSGEIVADTNAKYNMQEATANGLKIGAYFFSTAISEEEAIEEARWVADYISQYQITYPVAYNCEGFHNPENRQYNLTKTERTDFAIAFLNEIYGQGYTPMFYASKAEMTADTDWETSRIEKNFKIWVSQYPGTPYPETPMSTYAGNHDMRQFTNNGTVAGIDKPVDINVAYFGYASSVDAQNQDAPEYVEADVEALMNFTEVDEMVTSKDVTNLRDIPSQGDDSLILAQLKNGETARRTAVSDSGWSRLEIDGQRYYAVSNYLTTDLSYKKPVAEPDDGIDTEFTKVNEQVTPKIEVNLRKLPSVTREDATVVATVHAGEVFTRTGINTDHGWSRVEYNGQTLYCVSSYLNVVQ